MSPRSQPHTLISMALFLNENSAFGLGEALTISIHQSLRPQQYIALLLFSPDIRNDAGSQDGTPASSRTGAASGADDDDDGDDCCWCLRRIAFINTTFYFHL